MRHLCILGVEVPQCHISAIGDSRSLKNLSRQLPHVGNWRDKFFKEREGKYQVEVKEAKLQEKAKNKMKEMIESGKIKIEINPEKQNRHSLGHRLYEEYKKRIC